MSSPIFKGFKDIRSKVGIYLLYKVCNHVCIFPDCSLMLPIFSYSRHGKYETD